MRFQDALFNWMQIQCVVEARPDDEAARKTEQFFMEILTEDHQLSQVEITNVDDTFVHVQYVKEGKSKLQMFEREAVYQLLSEIEANPKYAQ
ncbi:hypothetical protein [Marinicrinis sediminis]|uniref:Uncharacterized protein n=1 Tax=Marinicrinis sediminis TaxID=1652465 RepID=A0ABW5RBC0_9BACL